jgi:hypothetical protein
MRVAARPRTKLRSDNLCEHWNIGLSGEVSNYVPFVGKKPPCPGTIASVFCNGPTTPS